MIKYLWRAPTFPMICEVDDAIIAAFTPARLDEQMDGIDLPADKTLRVLDGTGEDWGLVTEFRTLSPLAAKRRLTKKQVVELFNGSRTASELGVNYSTRGLSAKRLDRIIRDIAALIVDAPVGAGRDSEAVAPSARFISFERQ